MLSHYYTVHPRLSTHHPRLYPYQSSALTCQGSLAKIKLHRVRGCDLYTPYASTPLDPTSNSDKLLHPKHLCLWRRGGLSSCKLHPLCAISDIRNARICLIYQTWTTWRKPLTVNSSCFQTYNPGKAMGTEAMRAFGPSNILLQSWPLGGWCGDGWQSEPPSWGVSFIGEPLKWSKWKGLLGWWVHTWMSQPPCLHLTVHYRLGNGLTDLLGLS